MAKQKTSMVAILKSTGAALGAYLLLQMLLALLLVKGALPETRLFTAQAVSGFLAILPGTAYFARRSEWGTMVFSLLTALCFAAFLALIGLLCYDGIAGTTETVIRLLAAAGGGLAVGLLAGKGKKQKRRKKRAAVRAGR